MPPSPEDKPDTIRGWRKRFRNRKTVKAVSGRQGGESLLKAAGLFLVLPLVLYVPLLIFVGSPSSGASSSQGSNKDTKPKTLARQQGSVDPKVPWKNPDWDKPGNLKRGNFANAPAEKAARRAKRRAERAAGIRKGHKRARKAKRIGRKGGRRSGGRRGKNRKR